MKIGYARVSTQDQFLGMQEDALKQDGCIEIGGSTGFSSNYATCKNIEH